MSVFIVYIIFNRNSFYTKLATASMEKLEKEEKDEKHIGKLFRGNPKIKSVC